MSVIEGDSIFWIEVDRIKSNPYQPRRQFSEHKLASLADSVRQYGILQPLVVTRKETSKEDGGLTVEYELIAGERRLRASKIAGLERVPVIIRTAGDSEQMKLELAIIENLQREDLNPIDRAHAFAQLVTKFKFKHAQIAQKMGKSREYVSNSLRLLSLPEHIQQALAEGHITEGHSRPIMMLSDRPEEQETLFKEIQYRKLTVREAEVIARRIAKDRVRKKDRSFSSEIIELEQKLTESLGTRVQIESREVGGKIVIDYFSEDDIRNLLAMLHPENTRTPTKAPEIRRANISEDTPENNVSGEGVDAVGAETDEESKEIQQTKENVEKSDEQDDLYSVRNFSI